MPYPTLTIKNIIRKTFIIGITVNDYEKKFFNLKL